MSDGIDILLVQEFPVVVEFFRFRPGYRCALLEVRLEYVGDGYDLRARNMDDLPLRYPHLAFVSAWYQETHVLACPAACPHDSDPNPVIRAHHLGRSAVGNG